MDLLELLGKGDVEGFNQARGERTRPELFAADLAGLALAGIDLSDANLEKSDLTEVDLTDANLVKANLGGVDAGDAKFTDVLAIRAKLRGAWLENTDLSGGDFSRADLAEAMLVGTRGDGARFVRARLREVDAKNAAWPDVDLSESQLHKADFTGADLRRVDLTEATGQDVVFTNANLDGAVGTAVRLSGAKLQGASLVGARLAGINLSGADLSGANLSNADFSSANLTGVALAGARLVGLCLADACLDGVDFTGLDVTDVDLTGLDPRSLGLDDEQIATLATYGSAFDPDADLRFDDVAGARIGATVAVVWLNEDSEETRSVRWALLRDVGASGVLPLSASGVLAKAVLPDGDAFRVLLVQERPGGVSLVEYRLDAAGVVSAPKTLPLGYRPAGAPVFELEGETLWVYGIASRGPTVVVSRYAGPEDAGPLYTERSPTAQAFLGAHHPIVSCKGGVLIPVGRKGPDKPVRTPPGFPGRKGTAVPVDDKVVALWVEPHRGDRDPGGIRSAVLGGRRGDEIQVVGAAEAVVSMDALTTSDGTWVAWVDAPGADLLATELWVARLGDAPKKLDLGGMPVLAVAFAGGPTPGLVVTTLQKAALALSLDGTVLGTAGF